MGINFKIRELFNPKSFFTIAGLVLVIGLIIIAVLSIKAGNDWIGFWGNVVGSVFGGIVTLIGIRITLKNERQIAERQLQHDIERKFNEYLVFYGPIDFALETLIYNISGVELVLDNEQNEKVDPEISNALGDRLEKALKDYQELAKDHLVALDEKLPQMNKYYRQIELYISDMIYELSFSLKQGYGRRREIVRLEVTQTKYRIEKYKNRLLELLKSLV